MWNKYCDNDLQFKHLDDIYNRMKQKFGTVPVHGGDGNKKHKDEDDFELMKDKIQSKSYTFCKQSINFFVKELTVCQP